MPADFTGHYLDEAVPPHALDAILAPYRCCVEDGVPVWDRISNPASKLYHSLDRLLLPCTPDDRQVDKIIVGIYCDVEQRALDMGRSVYDLISPELFEQAWSA